MKLDTMNLLITMYHKYLPIHIFKLVSHFAQTPTLSISSINSLV